MITPIEIQNKVFKSGGLGYDKKDVDNLIGVELRSQYEKGCITNEEQFKEVLNNVLCRS